MAIVDTLIALSPAPWCFKPSGSGDNYPDTGGEPYGPGSASGAAGDPPTGSASASGAVRRFVTGPGLRVGAERRVATDPESRSREANAAGIRVDTDLQTAYSDALHMATAAAHQGDYLLTWNCNHIANAEILPRISPICERFNLLLPYICTPEELLGESQ